MSEFKEIEELPKILEDIGKAGKMTAEQLKELKRLAEVAKDAVKALKDAEEAARVAGKTAEAAAKTAEAAAKVAEAQTKLVESATKMAQGLKNAGKGELAAKLMKAIKLAGVGTGVGVALYYGGPVALHALDSGSKLADKSLTEFDKKQAADDEAKKQQALDDQKYKDALQRKASGTETDEDKKIIADHDTPGWMKPFTEFFKDHPIGLVSLAVGGGAAFLGNWFGGPMMAIAAGIGGELIGQMLIPKGTAVADANNTGTTPPGKPQAANVPSPAIPPMAVETPKTPTIAAKPGAAPSVAG